MKKLVLFCMLAILGLLAYLPIGANIWYLLTARGYIIPQESSVINFKPTTMNDGSGEWWEYAEDKCYFYSFTGIGSRPYIAFLKSNTKDCNGFNALNRQTWCEKLIVKNEKNIPH